MMTNGLGGWFVSRRITTVVRSGSGSKVYVRFAATFRGPLDSLTAIQVIESGLCEALHKLKRLQKSK